MPIYNFPPTSRYYGIETTVLTLADGREVRHLRRRLVPPAERFATLSTVTIQDGDRPDTLAATHLGDPLAFWRIADANTVSRPEKLTETPGRMVRITLPEGFPAMPDA